MTTTEVGHRPFHAWALVSVATVMVAATAATVVTTGPADVVSNEVGYLALLATLTVVMVVGWRVAGNLNGRRVLLAVVGAGVLARLMLVPTTPALSSDMYRYLWDGTVQQAGVNPYLHAPDASELAPLRDRDIWPRIDREDERTIYPGGAQLTFRVARALGIASPWSWKLLLTIADVGVLALLWRLIHARGGIPRDLLLYAWNPLPILAFAGSGHLDALAVVAVVAAVLQWRHGRHVLVGVLLGAAAAVKLYPLLLLPAFLRDRNGRWRWSVPVTAVVVLAATYVPYVAAGSRVLGYLTSGYLTEEGYASGRRFVLATMLGLDGAVLSGALLAGVAVWSMLTRRSVVTRSVALLAAALLLTTPYGWYATPLVALAVASPAGAGDARLLWPLHGIGLYAVYLVIYFGLRPVTPVTMRRILVLLTLAAFAMLVVAVRKAKRHETGGTPVLDLQARGGTDGITVVLPAWNEADAVPAALDGRPPGMHVIVVDNASTDDTSEVAREHGADVVFEPHRGFGAACLAGALAAPADHVIVFADADASFAWSDISRVGRLARDGAGDLVIGWRHPAGREAGAMPRHVAVANRALGVMSGWVAGVPLRDIGPLRAVRRETLLELQLQDRTYGWPLEMVLRAGQRGLHVTEVPVAYRVRIGTSKVTGRPVATLRASVQMVAVLVRLAVAAEPFQSRVQPRLYEKSHYRQRQQPMMRSSTPAMARFVEPSGPTET